MSPTYQLIPTTAFERDVRTVTKRDRELFTIVEQTFDIIQNTSEISLEQT